MFNKIINAHIKSIENEMTASERIHYMDSFYKLSSNRFSRKEKMEILDGVKNAIKYFSQLRGIFMFVGYNIYVDDTWIKIQRDGNTIMISKSTFSMYV